jgi:hypothetical protein
MTVMDGTTEHLFKNENYKIIPDEISLDAARFMQHKKPLSFKIIDSVKKKGEISREQAENIEPDFTLVGDEFKDELGGNPDPVSTAAATGSRRRGRRSSRRGRRNTNPQED